MDVKGGHFCPPLGYKKEAHMKNWTKLLLGLIMIIAILIIVIVISKNGRIKNNMDTEPVKKEEVTNTKSVHLDSQNVEDKENLEEKNAKQQDTVEESGNSIIKKNEVHEDVNNINNDDNKEIPFIEGNDSGADDTRDTSVSENNEIKSDNANNMNNIEQDDNNKSEDENKVTVGDLPFVPAQ